MDDRPVILLVADEQLPTIAAEIRARYDRDYRIETATSEDEALHCLRALTSAGAQIAMIGADVRVGEVAGPKLLRRTHALVPTARRVAFAAVGSTYRDHLEELRVATLERDIDTFLGIPQGARDEEFHTALTDLLSDWGSSVARPVVSMIDIVAEPGDRDAAAIRDLLSRLGFPFRIVDPASTEGRAILAVAPTPIALPVVRSFDGRVVNGATSHTINEQIYGGFDDIPDGTVADLLVIGAGPAGLAAAVYSASEGLATVVLERDAIGGQAGSSSMIRNYLGFPRGISGMRLAQRSRIQASRFGTQFYSGRSVERITTGPAHEPPHYHVHVGDSHLCARTILISTGVAYRRIGVDSLEALVGAGVYYGAATSMAREMQDRAVVVIGGGNSAGQAAMHLAKFAKTVTIVVRRDALAETMSDYLVREIAATPNIMVRSLTTVIDGGGEGRIEWVVFRDQHTGDEQVAADGVFCMLGAEPDCTWLPDGIALDDNGYILTGRNIPKADWTDGLPPAGLETALPGVFAAGDVRSGSMKRVASAAGDGASVLPLVHAHLELLRSREFAADTS